ncbi:MAG TPA: hypothetical protein ENI23_15005 [bacterium]|nr:hypothetical protein [bacterium]
MESVVCGVCKKTFETKRSRIKYGWGKWCSRKCFYESRKGHALSEETKRKISLANSGEKNGMWKGEKVTNKGIHDWLRRRLGKPKKCWWCGLDDPNKRYEWANLSRKYKRDLKDWARLCMSCHSKYDNKVVNLGEHAIKRPNQI